MQKTYHNYHKESKTTASTKFKKHSNLNRTNKKTVHNISKQKLHDGNNHDKWKSIDPFMEDFISNIQNTSKKYKPADSTYIKCTNTNRWLYKLKKLIN